MRIAKGPQIDKLQQQPGFGRITALTSGAIRELVAKGALQLSLLDQKNLAEINSPDYPGERLVVCHSPLLVEERARKRQALLAATEKSLTKIAKDVARQKKMLTAAEIGLKVGQVLGRYKVGKHFACQIGEGSFTWSRRQEAIDQEAKLDGIYVLRTSGRDGRATFAASFVGPLEVACNLFAGSGECPWGFQKIAWDLGHERN